MRQLRFATQMNRMETLGEPLTYRFEQFELDSRTRELRRDGRAVKLQDQPARLLLLLVSRAGQLVTRQEIEKALWPEGEFVEFEHAINTAVRKVREALSDDLERPRFLETLPRKGYRFIAAVETRTVEAATPLQREDSSDDPAQPYPRPEAATPNGSANGALSSSIPQQAAAAASSDATAAGLTIPEAVSSQPPTADFRLTPLLARTLFLITQAGYLAIYVAVLYKAEAVEEVLAALFPGPHAAVYVGTLVAAMCGIAVRLYLLSAVGLNHPAAAAKFRRLFVVLFFFDVLWALSPLLLIRKLGIGPALGSVAALAYLPFSQRTLLETAYGREGIR